MYVYLRMFTPQLLSFKWLPICTTQTQAKTEGSKDSEVSGQISEVNQLYSGQY